MRKFIFMLGLSITLSGCGVDNTAKALPSDLVVVTEEVLVDPIISSQRKLEVEVISEPVIEEYTLSIVTVGDNLIHSLIYNKALKEDGSYDFKPMYSDIKDYISSFDLAVINQETIFVEDNSSVSSYPCFGTPIDMGSAIIDTGFDIVLSATNHTWDKRSQGYEDTLNYWESYPDITLLGINDSQEDFESIDIIEKNGFKLAMFNYTYGLNGFTLPSDMQYAVNLLDYKDKFISDLQTIENDVDYSICFLHIGNEYVYEPTEYQVSYINDLIDAGADIIICAHPHVVEPYGVVTTDNGNSGLVYYSCGNFISNQNEVPRVLGGASEIVLKKKIQDGVEIENYIDSYTFTPLVTHYNKNEHKVMLLEDYTDELAKTHTLNSKGLAVDKLWSLWKDIILKEDK